MHKNIKYKLQIKTTIVVNVELKLSLFLIFIHLFGKKITL